MGDIPGTSGKGGAVGIGLLIGIISAGLLGWSDPHIQAMADDGLTFGEIFRFFMAFAVPATAYLKGKFEDKPQ